MDFIEAFFDDFERKVSFLQELFHTGHQDEAATLCYVYVDGLGYSLYWPVERSAFTFVRVLCEHGAQPFLSLIHPRGFARRLSQQASKKYTDLAARLTALLGDRDSELLPEAEFSKLIRPSLNGAEAALLDKQLWRGTLAFGAYEWLRNPFVHTLRGYGGLSFDQTTYRGRRVPDIDFNTIYAALQNINRHARKISEESGRFFVHGFSKKHLASKMPSNHNASNLSATV